jgi:RNA polymerase sigma-70 factor (ECF subfamily)
MALSPMMGETPASERAEVELAQRGEAEARERLARRCRRSAYLLALHLLGDPDRARDVAQEAMVRFFRSLGRLDSSRPVRPWLFRVVRNQVNDLWRRGRMRRTEALDGRAGDLAGELKDPSGDPEESAQRHELRRRLWQALAALPTAKREIMVLRDYHDLSYAEIAAVLRIPVGTVMSRLHAARKALREALGSEFAPSATVSGRKNR